MRRKTPRRRIEPPADRPSDITLLPVPKEGRCTVRFLGECISLIQHYHRDIPQACPGEEDCPAAIHRSGSRWKGYAAVERWRDVPYEDWLPQVLEITAGLWTKLQGRLLRGEVWTLWRELGLHGCKEVCGEHVDTVNADMLREDVPVEPTIYRVYGTKRILFGVEPPLPPLPVLMPSKSPPPRKAVKALPDDHPEEVRKKQAAMAKLRERIGRPTETPEPSANGRHR
jgi:hypothetical protein